MPKKRIALELGMGSSLRRANYSDAARRAVENALWRNSLTVADAFDLPREAMIVDVEIAVQKPELVDPEVVKSVFPYGQVTVKAVKGGLDIPKPAAKNSSGEPQVTVMAQAAIIVSFDLPAAGGVS
ncbi:MAG: Lin0512 family protein [Candidatus Puniceispirillaceae bacterium]